MKIHSAVIWLIAGEDLIAFACHESFKSWIKE
jgi:hypothetical protein